MVRLHGMRVKVPAVGRGGASMNMFVDDRTSEGKIHFTMPTAHGTVVDLYVEKADLMFALGLLIDNAAIGKHGKKACQEIR